MTKDEIDARVRAACHGDSASVKPGEYVLTEDQLRKLMAYVQPAPGWRIRVTETFASVISPEGVDAEITRLNHPTLYAFLKAMADGAVPATHTCDERQKGSFVSKWRDVIHGMPERDLVSNTLTG